MDATSTIFVVVIVLLGGPLALFADWLGRRLGKKRHTLFGLRPRHTAGLLTFLAGVFIPLLAIAAMLVLSKDVRQWVVEGRRALQEKRRLEGLNHSLDDQILQKNLQYEDLSKRNKQAQMLYAQERKLADDLQVKLNGLNKQLEEQKKKLASEAIAMRKLGADVRLKTMSIARINSELVKRQQDLARQKRDLTTLQAHYRQLDGDYKALDAERTKLDKLNQGLQAQNDQLGPEVEALKAQKATLQKDFDEIGRNLAQTRSDLTQARADLSAAQAELTLTYQQANNLIGPSRIEQLIYKRDDEIVRLTADSDLSADAAAQKVQAMLALARTEARSRGAEAHENVNVVGFSPTTAQNPITPLEAQAALTRAITGRRQPLVMIAFTPINVFRTEAVLIRVRVLPNPLVYHQGQTITQTQIDGHQDADAIIQQLRTFLSEKLTQQAIEDQMIPRQGQDTPLGEVGFRQILDVVQSIKKEDHLVKLLVVAKVDTRAADSLQIEFKVVR